MNFPAPVVRRGLWSAAVVLALCAVGLWLGHQPPAATEMSLNPPAEANIGVPGVITLRLCSWRRPQSAEWGAVATAGWEFTPWRCDWRGLSAHGWQWQLSRKFWAVQLCPAGALTLHGPGQSAFTGVLPAIHPRENLTGLLAVTAVPLAAGAHDTAGWIFALAVLCCLADLLGLLWQHSRPQARMLRRLAEMHYSPDNALRLRRCWRRNANLAIGQREMAALLNRLCFQAAPGKEALFAQARHILRCALLRNPAESLNHP